MLTDRTDLHLNAFTEESLYFKRKRTLQSRTPTKVSVSIAKVIFGYRLNNNSFPQTIIFGCHGDSVCTKDVVMNGLKKKEMLLILKKMIQC